MEDSSKYKIKELLNFSVPLAGLDPDAIFDKILKSLNLNKTGWSKLTENSGPVFSFYSSQKGNIIIQFRLETKSRNCTLIRVICKKTNSARNHKDDKPRATANIPIQEYEIKTDQIKIMKEMLSKHRNFED